MHQQQHKIPRNPKDYAEPQDYSGLPDLPYRSRTARSARKEQFGEMSCSLMVWLGAASFTAVCWAGLILIVEHLILG